MEPVVLANPFGNCIGGSMVLFGNPKCQMCDAYFLITSSVLSVEPASMMMYSRLG